MTDQTNAGAAEAGWYPDPSGRHEQRYYDGKSWTSNVADGGKQSHDDPASPAPGSSTRPQASYTAGAKQPTPPGGVTMTDAVQRVLSKYVAFSGRAPRSEYWWWTLAVMLFYVVITFIAAAAAGASGDAGAADAILGLAALALFLPSLGVTVRRLHDVDKSGWWILISLIPIVGPIVLLVFLATEGTVQPNKWGPPVSHG